MADNDCSIMDWRILIFALLVILVVVFVFADFILDVQALEDCKQSAMGLCETKDMQFSGHYIEGDDTVMVECNTQYEVHTYVVNCGG